MWYTTIGYNLRFVWHGGSVLGLAGQFERHETARFTTIRVILSNIRSLYYGDIALDICSIVLHIHYTFV